MSSHDYRTVIEERQLDIFGHVNNAAYLELFEAARWDWITGNGFGRREILERRIGPTILEAKLRFKKEIRGTQRVLIRTRSVAYRGKIGRVEQVLMTEDGQAACVAEFVMALFDLDTRRLIPPTPGWLRAVGLGDGPEAKWSGS